MQNEAKVVSIGHSTISSAHTGLLPALLIQLRDNTSVQLKKHLQELFTLADDSLFDLAERADSNSQQNLLFEAMRDLRLKRKNLERSFMQAFADSFGQLRQRTIGGSLLSDTPSMENLSLVQNDELEESVAIDTMVSKVNNREQAALSHLQSRIEQVLQRKIHANENPLGPRALSSSFLDASNILGFDIQIKLIILKLFDRAVLDNIQGIYQSANELLANAGVLPALETAKPARQRPSATPASSTLNDLVETSHSQTLLAFHELQGLLGQLRNSQPMPSPPADAVPISSQDLMRLLSHLQQHNSGIEDSGAVRKQLDSILLRASQQSSKPRVVGEIDNDVINLVSMLFDFILDDRSIPSTLKALIGRMQIPLLKIAVMDKSFFDNKKHPARLLLNEIGTAALGWNEQDSQQQDSLHQKVESVVQRLQRDFADNPEIFSELYIDFANFIRNERRRSELLEQRVRDAEEGRARSERARAQVEHELNQRLVGKVLPDTVVQILQDSWSRVMLLTHLKHGDDSKQWQHCISVMDRLIWSVGEHQDSDTLINLQAMIPTLLQDLQQGFSEAALDPFATSMLFTKLEVLHVQALQRAKSLRAVTAESAIEEPLSPAEVPEELQRAAEQLQHESQPQAPVMIEVKEHIALSEQSKDAHAEPEIDENHPGLALVDRLAAGSWFELNTADDSATRCKLAAIIKTTGRYIFVNRRGLKVLEKSRAELAIDLSEGRISMLDDSQLFDRALESVISDLRRLKN